jgi:hypothetical protein
MQDDPTKIDVAGLISIAQYPEIRDWCKELGCTEVELAEAVAVVGYSAEKVRAFLAARGPKSTTTAGPP